MAADGDPLLEQVMDMRRSLFHDKLVNEQFVQLEGLEGVDESPHFVEDVYDIFFVDALKYVESAEQVLAKEPFDKLEFEKEMHKLKGSATCAGANQILRAVNRAWFLLDAGTNVAGLHTAVEGIKDAHKNTRGRLETYFELKRQLLPEEAEEMMTQIEDSVYSDWDESDD